MDAIEAAEREARDKWLDALERLIQTPASDFAALAEKVAIVEAEYGDENEWIADLLRDVTTLGGRA